MYARQNIHFVLEFHQVYEKRENSLFRLYHLHLSFESSSGLISKQTGIAASYTVYSTSLRSPVCIL